MVPAAGGEFVKNGEQGPEACVFAEEVEIVADRRASSNATPNCGCTSETEVRSPVVAFGPTDIGPVDSEVEASLPKRPTVAHPVVGQGRVLDRPGPLRVAGER